MFSNGQLVQASDLNTFSVTTVTTSGALVVGTTATIGTTLGVTGAATLSSTLAVTGTTSPLALLDISGAGAGQIKFPATQNASTNANTLDDYEEGNWTPVLGGSGGTSGQVYGTQIGRYVKIGQLVTAWYDLTLSTKGTITTNCEIQGLVHAGINVGNVISVGLIEFTNLGTNWVQVTHSMVANTSVARVFGLAAAATTIGTPLTTADITDTTTVRGVIIYRAAA